MTHVSLALLGPMQVTLNGQPIASFPYEKVRSLLAYLAIESHYPHHRDQLAALLWPDQCESMARSNLRKALSTLRHLLSDTTANSPLFLTTRHTIQFNPANDHTLDVAQLTHLLETYSQHYHPKGELCAACVSALEQALALYRGKFLDQMALPDSEAFETWILHHRDRFHQQVIHACTTLVCHYEQQRNPKAQPYIQRQLQLEPWNEAAHRSLMRLLAQTGQRQAALQQFDRCCQLLDQELASEPDPDTVTLWQAIRSGDFPSRVPVAIDRRIEVVNPNPDQSSQRLDSFVQLVRSKTAAHLQTRCGVLRVLDMTQPIGLETIYTPVSLLKFVRGKRRTNLLHRLLHQSNRTGLSPLDGMDNTEERIPGLQAVEQHSKLIILGKPGAGKTTFLKWLAIQCNNGHLWADLVPIFITLKTFAETKGQPDLLSYIQKQWTDCGGSDALISDASIIAELLQQGCALVLLDGLDEVRDPEIDRVLQDIREFSTRFHTCRFVITCRVAAREYTFEPFTEVEITDFDDLQIRSFVTQWFTARSDLTKAERLLQKLQDEPRIQDLATNALLLTLLCLVFEESADFSANRAELYREAVHILLKKWDDKRHIQRDGFGSDSYQKLPLPVKEGLLSHIAFTLFDRGEYLFKQQVVEQQITQFIRTLPTHKTNPGLLDSEMILKAVEAQHGLLVERARGIYSFSHLTFQEYFTAQKVASDLVYRPTAKAIDAFQELVSHITEPEWREVFLLTAGMLPSADTFLLGMKAHIDALLTDDTKLQQFLVWLNEKASAVETTHKPVTVRTYYSYLLLNCTSASTDARLISAMTSNDVPSPTAKTIYFSRNPASAMVRELSGNLVDAIVSTSNVTTAIAITIDIAEAIVSNLTQVTAAAETIDRTLTSIMNRAIALVTDLDLERSLQALQNQLPEPRANPLTFKEWWNNQGSTWIGDLKAIIVRYRNLDYDWQFNPGQLTKLEQYYRANRLLIDCLNSDCSVGSRIREEIETTLILPQGKIL